MRQAARVPARWARRCSLTQAPRGKGPTRASSGTATGPAAPFDAHLRQAVKRRALQLADDLKRSRLSTRELNRALVEAFADPEDDRVYRAVRRWMKDREKVKAQVTEPEG